MWFCHGNHCMGSGTLLETTVHEHSSPYHPQKQVKSLLCKNEVICEADTELLPSSLDQSSFKMWGKVENCYSDPTNLNVKFAIQNCSIPHTKEEEGRPACGQNSVHLLWYVGALVPCGTDNFAHLERHHQCWKVYKQHTLPSSGLFFFFREGLASITTAWLRRRRVWLLDWPACSYDKHNYDKRDPGLLNC